MPANTIGDEKSLLYPKNTVVTLGGGFNSPKCANCSQAALFSIIYDWESISFHN